MSEQNYVIELGPGDRAIVEADDTAWLEDKLRREPGPTSFRLMPDDNDTEGHGRSGTRVRVLIEDGDDTEGHALSIHFPSVAEADAFRRRLLLTGVLVGTVAVGAATGAGISALTSQDAGTAGAGVVATQAGPMDAHEAPAFEAAAAADLGQYNPANLGGTVVTTQTGPMDAHEAPAFQGPSAADLGQYNPANLGGTVVAPSTDADRDIGIMDGSAAAAATQTGPMDAHEAPAFQASAPATDADRDIGIMDGSNAAAATQTGPMDAHEAPAFQSGAGEAEDTEVEGLGGPIPR